MVGIIKSDRHRCVAQRLSRLCSGENNILHIAAAQRFRALFTEHPAHSVRNVALAAAVWTYDPRDSFMELQVHLVGK